VRVGSWCTSRNETPSAVARGIRMKDLLVNAVDREITIPPLSKARKGRPALPVIHLEKGRVPDLSNFDFDDLLT
jgi:hypothetical protein